MNVWISPNFVAGLATNLACVFVSFTRSISLLMPVIATEIFVPVSMANTSAQRAAFTRTIFPATLLNSVGARIKWFSALFTGAIGFLSTSHVPAFRRAKSLREPLLALQSNLKFLAAYWANSIWRRPSAANPVALFRTVQPFVSVFPADSGFPRNWLAAYYTRFVMFKNPLVFIVALC